MKLQLKTITPVHVGNGKKLYDLDYIVTSGHYYRISQGEFLKFLKNYPEHIGDYSGWITQTTNDLENLKDAEKNAKNKKQQEEAKDFNQKFNQIKTKFNLLEFIKQINKEEAFIYFINNNPNILKIPFNDQLKGEIRGLLTTATDKPYLAGSSIKGSIRTALFYNYLINNGNVKELLSHFDTEIRKAKQVEKNGEKDKIKKHFSDKIEQDAFYCQHTCTTDRKPKTNDEKLDIFKFLTISDGIIHQPANEILSLKDIKLYLVKKEQNRQPKNFDIEAKEQTQAPYIEAIKPNIPIEITIDFNIEFLFSIKDKLTKDGIKIKEGYQWIGLADKIKKVFDLDIFTLTKDNLETKRAAVIQHIIHCVKQFSAKQLEAHRQWIEHFKKHDKEGYSPKIEEGFWLLNHLEKSQNLIHLGYGTGFTGITALLYVLDNKELKEKYREVMEVFGIGNAPNNKGTYIPNPDGFPKSKRLAKGKNAIQLLGWLTFVDDKTPKDFADLKYEAEQKAKEEAMKSVQPEYFNGKINHKKPFLIEAQVISSDALKRTNEIKLFISKENTPNCILHGNPIEKGRVIIVQVSFSKKLAPTNLSFKSYKKG